MRIKKPAIIVGRRGTRLEGVGYANGQNESIIHKAAVAQQSYGSAGLPFDICVSLVRCFRTATRAPFHTVRHAHSTDRDTAGFDGNYYGDTSNIIPCLGCLGYKPYRVRREGVCRLSNFRPFNTRTHL